MSRMHPEAVQQASLYLEQGRVYEALAMLYPFVRRNPQDTEALYLLGLALANCDRSADSLRVLGRTVEIDPQHGRAFRGIGHQRLVGGDPVGAEPFLRLAYSLAPDEPWTRHDLATALSQMQRADEARRLFREALEADPGDVVAMAKSMYVETGVGATDSAREWADRILLHEDLNETLLGWVLAVAMQTRDVDLARRTVARLFDAGLPELLKDPVVLLDLAEAFPAEEDHLLMGEAETLCCPTCGDEAIRGPLRGVIFDDDRLARCSALAAMVAADRCDACGFHLPETLQTFALWPELSIAILIDEFPGNQEEVGTPVSMATGSFDEPANAHPAAGSWFVISLVGAGSMATSAFVGEMAREVESNLPFIGDFGRAERRAREVASMIRAAAGFTAEEDDVVEPDPGQPGIPHWMLVERRMLLESGIAVHPWRLDHRCPCGADLRRFLFGKDPGRLYESARVDEAAIEGRPFADPVTGETMHGFNCDACGRLHTWVMGVVPSEPA